MLHASDRCFWYDETDSTQDILKALALQKFVPDFTAVAAGQQTSGRGSRGRVWQAPAGNLSVSIILPVLEHPHYRTRVALLAGLILRDIALVTLAHISSYSHSPELVEKIAYNSPTSFAGMSLFLKWPNDLCALFPSASRNGTHHTKPSLLKTGVKLGGVLLEGFDQDLHRDVQVSGFETPVSSASPQRLILGIGLNIAYSPNLDRETGSLIDLLPPDSVNPEVVLHQKTAQYIAGQVPEITAKWFAILETSPDIVPRLWQKFAHPVGYPLNVQHGGVVQKGTYQGLTPEGGMRLRHGAKEEDETILYAGTVLT